jgi:hypothetical protein
LKRKTKLASKLKVPKRLAGFVSKNDLELIQEHEAISQIKPAPKPLPKPGTSEFYQLRSEEFDGNESDRIFLSADDKYRGSLLVCLLANSLPLNHKLDSAASVMKALRPRNTLEVLLFSQMTAVHTGAMCALGWAMNTDSRELADLWTARANRLLRTFCLQIEALDTLRHRGTRQKIVVKHESVNVLTQEAIIGVREGKA